MADFGANGPLIASLLQGQRQEENPFQAQRKYGRQLIVQGSSVEPLHGGGWLEGLSRALQAGIGGLTAGYANQQEEEQNKNNIDVYSRAAVEKDPAKIGEILKGLKGGGAQQEGLLGQIIQNNVAEGLKQQQAGQGITTGGYGTGNSPGAPPGGGTSITITPGQQSSNPNNVGNIGPGRQYATPQAGAADLTQLLKSYPVQYNNGQPMTLNQIAKIYAPTDDGKNPALRGNNPAQWALNVGARSGINPNEPLDFDNPAVMTRVVQGINPAEKAPGDVQPPAVLQEGVRQGMDPAAFPPQPSGQPQPQGVQTAQAGPPQVSDAPPISPAAQQMRARGQQLEQSGNKVAALTLYQKADEEQAKFADALALEKGKKALDQPAEDAKNQHNMGLSEHNLRQEFDQLGPVRNFRTVQPIFRSAIEAAKGNDKASDLNMVYAFATMMDPGSVVREGEAGMVRATQSASDYVKGLVNSVQGSATLSPQARANLLEQMSNRYQAMKSAHDEIASSYERIATNSGMRPENIIARLPDVPYTSPGKKQPGAATGPTRIDINGNPL